jgi:hypothetical protein
MMMMMMMMMMWMWMWMMMPGSSAGIFVGIRHNVPPVSFADAPRGRGGSSKLPLALIAAAPLLDAADEAAAAAAEAGRNGNAHAAGVPQLLVEELNAAPSWELQAYVPGAAAGPGAQHAPGSSSSSNAGYSRGSSGSHFQQQQQQYSSSGKWGSGSGGSSSGSGYKQERRGVGSSSGGSMAPQSLPGSLGLVQQQLADVLQPQVGWMAGQVKFVDLVCCKLR